MKLFASLYFSVVLSVVSSKENNEMTTARIVINGLQGDLTPDDVQLAHDTIATLTSPSVPYPQPSLRAHTFAIKTDADEVNEDSIISLQRATKSRPSCGGWGCGGWDPKNPTHQRGRWYGYGKDFSCGPLCHNDDKFLMDEVVASALIVTDIHSTGIERATEEKFCDILRQQGSSALTHVTTCTVAPMRSAPSLSSLCVDGSKVGEALVFVDGASMNQVPDSMDDDDDRSSMTDDEVDALEKSVKDAYNAAFQEVGLVLKSFQALNMAVPPKADNSSSTDISSTVIMGEFHQLCTNVDVHYNDKDMDHLHQMFEILLCENLRDSGLPIFHQVKSCGYRTFHSHASTSKDTSQAQSLVSEE